MRATTAGVLPAETDAIVGGVRLPRGRRIVAAGFGGAPPPAEPVLWISEQRIPEASQLRRKLAAGFAQHGLWPLVLDSLSSRDDARPWLAGELDPGAMSSPSAHDPAAVLARAWGRAIPDESEDPDATLPLSPFGRAFPGLAAPGTGEAVLDEVDLEGRLGLVSVTRPADAIAAIGWAGPLNHENDVGKLAAVLRSWEDRFGAYLVGLGFDTMAIAVQRPVRDIEHALAVAAEHFALCPDNIYQGAGTLHDYVADLLDAPVWHFWWD